MHSVYIVKLLKVAGEADVGSWPDQLAIIIPAEVPVRPHRSTNIKRSRDQQGVPGTYCAMPIGPRLDQLARLLADPSRAEIVGSLMDGRQRTGRELARVAHVTPSTASSHLQQLIDGEIVSVFPHGRHKYYRISRPEVAHVLEGLMSVAPHATPRHADDRAIDEKLRHLRTCYDHLAGKVAVALAESLAARGAIVVNDGAARVTPLGVDVFANAGIQFDGLAERRPLCRPCLDWSERRYHLAGRVGAALARHAIQHAWVVRRRDTRALEITEHGIAALRSLFGVECASA